MDKKSPINNNNNRNETPSPAYSPELSPLSSVDHRSPPPSDLRHVSPSHPSKNNSILNNSPIITSSKLHFHTPSADSSPSSDLCHVSPSPSPQTDGVKNPSEPHFPSRSADSSPSSDLCHVSPSPPHRNSGVKSTKNSVFTSEGSSPESGPCHVSPSPRPSVRREKAVLRAARREKEVKKAALGVRVFGAAFCLVSLAVMAADKERGWAVDSFYRYKEFRYCISVNVVGFLYSIAQTCDLVFTICTGKYVLRHQYRFYFDFAFDQTLTYLLMSASSSAATRVDDWESNWGKDQFPMMASISVGLSFMSFVSLAASTLISGYALCTWSST